MIYDDVMSFLCPNNRFISFSSAHFTLAIPLSHTHHLSFCRLSNACACMNIGHKTRVNDQRDELQHPFYIVDTHAIVSKSMGEKNNTNMYNIHIWIMKYFIPVPFLKWSLMQADHILNYNENRGRAEVNGYYHDFIFITWPMLNINWSGKDCIKCTASKNIY